MRGVCIIIVVFVHLAGRMGFGGYSSVLGSVLQTFFLPLFFFISGFFVYRLCSSWSARLLSKVLKSRVQSMLICPIVFFALFAGCFGGHALGWLELGFGGFWFTIVLFQCFAIFLAFSLLAKLLKKEWLLDTGMVAVSCGSLLLFILAPGDSTLWTVLCMENFCKYLQFYTLGMICRKYIGLYSAVCSADWFRTASCASFVLLLFLYFNDGFKASGGWLYQAVHDIFVRYAGVFVVVAYFYAKREVFARKNRLNELLGLIGRRTLDIYMIHYFILPDMSFMGDFLVPNTLFILQIFVGMLLSAMVIAVCLLLSSMLRTSRFLSSWLFGVVPRS